MTTLQTPRLVCLATVAPEEVVFLWPGRIPLGKLTTLEGHPGVGKSTIALTVAAYVTGGPALPGAPEFPPAAVVVLTAEDGLGDTVRPRLEAAGGDPRRVHSLRVVEQEGADVGIVLPEHIPALAEAIETTGARLVIVDVLAAFLSGAVDSYRDHDVRRALSPLAQLAETSGVALVILRHLTKRRHGSAVLAGGGSIGISGAARSILLAATHPTDPSRCVLAHAKSNLAPRAPSLIYQLVSEGHVARANWQGETELTADDLVGEATSEARGDRGIDIIRQAVEAAGGTTTRAKLLAHGREYGLSARTVDRAIRGLGLERRSRGFGKAKQCVLSLEADEQVPF